MVAKLKLVGQRFGRLRVLKEDVVKTTSGKIKWLCLCQCGNQVSVVGSSLISGNTKSCGCFNKEVVSKLKTKHGLSNHSLYYVWLSMKMRCINPRDRAYNYYGGRGIVVCDRWLESFESFYEDVIGCYKGGLELDRIDNDKGYNIDNCRWVTRQQNNMNIRSHKNSSSEYKGVSYRKKIGRWQAGIRKDGKGYNLGTFTCEKEAALAYNKAALRMFGDYSNLNKAED